MLTATLLILLMTLTFQVTLALLNQHHRHDPIPANVADVYDPVAYQRWLDYTSELHRLNLVSTLVQGAAVMGMLVFQGFPRLAYFINRYQSNPVWQALLFLGLIYGLYYTLSLGFKLYRTFYIEKRYGFSTTSPRIFFLDQLKSLILGLTVGGPLLFSLISLYFQALSLRVAGGHWVYWIRTWLLAWLLITLVTLAGQIMYTKVFIRLFYTLTPLTEGALFDKITALASQVGYAVRDIRVMNASKRTRRLNGFFSGFGRFKRIVLYDTLMEKCSTEEILAVLAHELGHARHQDVLKGFLRSILQIGMTLALLLYFLSEAAPWSAAFGFDRPYLGFSLMLFAILTEPLGLCLNLPLMALSRKAELRADAFAAACGLAPGMIQALKRLARENFSNLTPHPLVVKFMYTHPPVSRRIAELESFLDHASDQT